MVAHSGSLSFNQWFSFYFFLYKLLTVEVATTIHDMTRICFIILISAPYFSLLMKCLIFIKLSINS